MPNDEFGIAMLKPSKRNGQEWFLGDNAENDERFDTRGDNIGGNAEDGFFTNESDFRYHILTTKGYKSPGTVDHEEWIERGYISYPEDWRNIEFTGEFRYDGDDDFSLYTRSGRHTGSGNCEGTKYSVSLRPDGDCRFAKETHHPSGYAFTDWKSSGLGNIDNEWVRIKFLCYDVAAHGQPLGSRTDNVVLELWIDPDFNNSWKKVNSTTDNGENWGEGGEQCGTGEKQGFLFGGPFTTLRGDAANRVSFRKMSVREIDIGGSFGGGTGGGTGGAPPTPTDPPPTNIPGTGNPQIDPTSVGKDRFGISMLFPSPVGGFSWINNWDNGTVYSNIQPRVDPWFHPTDPYFSIEEEPNITVNIDGRGILRIQQPSGPEDYRLKVYDPNDQKRFVNVEATVYYSWESVNYGDPEQLIGRDTIRVGTDHHFSTANCPYNAHDYHASINREGMIYIGREALHPIEHPARPDPGMAITKNWWTNSQNQDRPPIGVWVGFKFVKRLIDGGKNVLLQIYRDLSDGANGGDWKLLMEFKHIEGSWQDAAIDEQVQQLVDQSFEQLTECRIPPSSDSPDPVHNHSGGMCMLRGDPVANLRLKKLSFREITDADTPLPNQPGGCPPGFRRDAQGNCVPIDGSGGSVSSGDASIVFKDFFDVYHIGTTDADSCNISGLVANDDLIELYTVDESDEFYELYKGLRTQAGIFIATTASKLMNWTARKFQFFLSKFGLPSGLISFTVNDANGRFKYAIGSIAAELLTPEFEEYTFTIPSHNIAFGLNWGIWVSYQGGNPEAFVKVAIKSGNPFDGAHTTAIRFGAGTAREQMPDHDLCGTIWH
jgi:hypothetical protein